MNDSRISDFDIIYTWPNYTWCQCLSQCCHLGGKSSKWGKFKFSSKLHTAKVWFWNTLTWWRFAFTHASSADETWPNNDKNLSKRLGYGIGVTEHTIHVLNYSGARILTNGLIMSPVLSGSNVIHKKNQPIQQIIIWRRRNSDHEGCSPRAKPFHCTSVGLTPAITPNVGKSTLRLVRT